MKGVRCTVLVSNGVLCEASLGDSLSIKRLGTGSLSGWWSGQKSRIQSSRVPQNCLPDASGTVPHKRPPKHLAVSPNWMEMALLPEHNKALM